MLEYTSFGPVLNIKWFKRSQLLTVAPGGYSSGLKMELQLLLLLYICTVKQMMALLM